MTVVWRCRRARRRRRSTATTTPPPMQGGDEGDEEQCVSCADEDDRQAVKADLKLRPRVSMLERLAGTRCSARSAAAGSARAHQRLADEHRVARRAPRSARSCSGVGDARLRDDGHARRDLRPCSALGALDVDAEVAQVAVVDPDRSRPRPRARVRAPRRRGPRPARPGRARAPASCSAASSRVAQRRDDQQHRVGARGARLVQLVGIDDEVLAQQRQLRTRRAPRAGPRASRRSSGPR